LELQIFLKQIFYKIDATEPEVRTKKINSIFSLIPLMSSGLDKIKSGEPIDIDQFSAKVSPLGFEPRTASLEGRCSIQLSYGPLSG
jgi:site-specific DNA recombinase